MKNVLVTGGAGFIGEHLCTALLEKGYKIACVDNLQRGNTHNIEHLMKNPLFTFYNVDARDQIAMEEIMDKEEIDFVFHLAANTDLWESMNNPNLEDECTFMTTKSVLNAMRNKGVKNMFFSSTSVIYGEPKSDQGFREDDELFPISYYGASKMASEAYIYAYAFMNDINVLIYRFSNIIGDKMTHGVIRDFILRLKDDPSKLEVRGNGLQTKPYLYVTELVDAILLLAGKATGVEIFNVGATTCTNVRFIANAVVHEMGLDGIPICYEECATGYKGDIAQYQYNIDKIRAKGWNWTMTSDETILRTVKELVAENT